MSLSDFTIDKIVNLEGLIAALAILGAVIGFILNLIKNWRHEYKEKRYRGTNFIILDLLEQHFREGLSETKLWELYNSQSTLVKRKKFTAFNPTKLGKIGFEGQLKHLQSNFLIRLTGPAHYHIDFSRTNDWTNYHRKIKFQEIVDSVRVKIGSKELNQILSSTISSDDISIYQKKDTQRYLLEEGDKQGINNLISSLKSEDIEVRKEAVEFFIEINNEIV